MSNTMTNTIQVPLRYTWNCFYSGYCLFNLTNSKEASVAVDSRLHHGALALRWELMAGRLRQIGGLQVTGSDWWLWRGFVRSVSGGGHTHTYTHIYTHTDRHRGKQVIVSQMRSSEHHIGLIRGSERSDECVARWLGRQRRSWKLNRNLSYRAWAMRVFWLKSAAAVSLGDTLLFKWILIAWGWFFRKELQTPFLSRQEEPSGGGGGESCEGARVRLADWIKPVGACVLSECFVRTLGWMGYSEVHFF